MNYELEELIEIGAEKISDLADKLKSDESFEALNAELGSFAGGTQEIANW